MQVTVKTLRHYEQKGLLHPSEVDEWTGYRYYNIAQMQRLNTIRGLQRQGFTLEEIKELLVKHLQELKDGRSVECPVYSFSDHNRTTETTHIAPTRVVILEGILIFQNPELRDLLDIKIFVETDADVRILRRAIRDVKKRGRTLESVMEQYLTTVKPMHEQFVEPSRKFADIVVLEGGRNLVALDLIMQRIENHIKA